MESIYHIENDIDCRVLKFGKEICIAIAGEDTVITLLKGRHKLTFQSLENSKDQLTIVFEVPENDIEDFIDVILIPIRDRRIHEENRIIEEKRKIAIEQARKEEENRIRLLEEERKKRLEIEEQNRRIAKEKEEERLKQVKLEEERKALLLKDKEDQENLLKIKKHQLETHRKIENAINNVKYAIKETTLTEEYSYEGCYWVKKALADGKNNKTIYNLYKDGQCISDIDFIKVNKYSEGLALVRTDKGHHFINPRGEIVLGPFYAATSFHNNIAYIYDGKIIKSINKNGDILKTYKSVIPNRYFNIVFPYIFMTTDRDDDSNTIKINLFSFGELTYTIKIGGFEVNKTDLFSPQFHTTEYINKLRAISSLSIIGSEGGLKPY